MLHVHLTSSAAALTKCVALRRCCALAARSNLRIFTHTHTHTHTYTHTHTHTCECTRDRQNDYSTICVLSGSTKQELHAQIRKSRRQTDRWSHTCTHTYLHTHACTHTFLHQDRDRCRDRDSKHPDASRQRYACTCACICPRS